ncbi:sensor domain-containing protein [Methylomonas sp. MgM2]
MLETLNRLKLILNAITDGILVVDQEGIVLYANPAAEQLLELQPIVGQSLAIPIATGTSQPQDINILRRNSGIGWAEMRTVSIVWEDVPAYVIGLHDITDRKQTELALQQSEAMFQTLARLAPVGIFKSAPNGDYEYVNQRWRDISGVHTGKIAGDNWQQTVFIDDKERVLHEWHHTIKTQTPFSCQFRFQHQNGPIRWVIGRAMPEYNHDRQLLGYVGTITDITGIKRHEEHLRQAAAVFETTREGVIITDAECKIQRVNRAFCEITGYGSFEILGQTPSLLRSGRHPTEFYSTMWSDIAQSGHWQGEIWNRRKNGEIYPELLSISSVKNQRGELTNYVGVFADITKLKASEKELEFLAHHDPLTKLPNRMMFMSRLQHAIDSAIRKQATSTSLAVLMLDLDRFKDVNDSFGHVAGDELLQLVSERLRSRLRASDTICRQGGDEFVILLEELNHAEDAARIGESIIKALNGAWQLSSGHEVRIGVSIGIALFPEHGRAGAELVQHADTALYLAKGEGRNCFKYFSDELTLAARERIKTEFRLRQAIDKGELKVFFQPQFHVNDDKLVGAEALIRWQTGDGELIPPMRFIPIAEETGLIALIGQWVLEETCRQGKYWQDQGYPPLRLAVNLSPKQFLHHDISDMVAKTLEKTGFPANCLELELTESTLMKREKEGIDILSRLHSLGVKLAIDDFGTGYSSLAYLKAFPLDVLKIDKSFIDEIPIHRDDREITATIIAIAKHLRMRVIAEGVETFEQMEFLKAHECDFYQGYYRSKPIPAKEFEHFLSQQLDQTRH